MDDVTGLTTEDWKESADKPTEVNEEYLREMIGPVDWTLECPTEITIEEVEDLLHTQYLRGLQEDFLVEFFLKGDVPDSLEILTKPDPQGTNFWVEPWFKDG